MNRISIAVAFVLGCGSGSSLTTGRDAGIEDSQTASDSMQAPSDGPQTPSDGPQTGLDASGTHQDASVDGSSLDGSQDVAIVDAPTCTPLPVKMAACGAAVQWPTQYCLNPTANEAGLIVPVAAPTPAACQCQETYNCTCMMAQPNPCSDQFPPTCFGGAPLNLPIQIDCQ